MIIYRLQLNLVSITLSCNVFFDLGDAAYKYAASQTVDKNTHYAKRNVYFCNEESHAYKLVIVFCLKILNKNFK
jgi:hypothetical protein